MLREQINCTNQSNNNCFFCIMKERDSSVGKTLIKEYLKGISSLDDDDDDDLILVVSELWKIAMTRPDDEDLPSLGIFQCMANLIDKSIHDKEWLIKNQNVYIPYYAAHIIGSYTMNEARFAALAVESGVVPPLMELLRGEMSWVEQRVAVRALGHLASYEETFEAVAVYEEEVVELAMRLASSCLDDVYNVFVGMPKRKRVEYHCNLLTRGVGGAEKENRKAEEWARQLQCWSVHLLNCFAVKERSLGLICKSQDFLKNLSEMWGGVLVNHTSTGGIELLRILCYTKIGRVNVSKSKHVIENLCRISRSSDDLQYMGIDCLLLLLKDPNTRYEVIEVATSYLVDLIELKNIGNRKNVGEAITRALVCDYNYQNSKKIKNLDHVVQRGLQETWGLKIERRRREKVMTSEKLMGKRIISKLVKQQANRKFSVGEIEEAVAKYTECLEICPLRYRSERAAMYSNRARCHLLLNGPDRAISDATRALCLSCPPNSHANSLWIRSQAYDIKGMAKESLMDCLMFLNVCTKSKSKADNFRVRIPYYAVRMIGKQMESTWIFRDARLKAKESTEINGKRHVKSGLSTIKEEPFAKQLLERD
ncbi:hypothetical protein ABFS83_03G041700 [Erythranthe nasuta]